MQRNHARLLARPYLPIRFLCITIFAVGIVSNIPEALAQYTEDPVQWNDVLNQETQWYGSNEAIRIAENVLVYQDQSGGWPKNINMAQHLSPAEKNRIRTQQKAKGQTPDNITIDNGATHTQMRFLARVYKNTLEARYKEGVTRGLDYLLAAQYDNGGWPQFYPLRDGYYSQITYNDHAMVGVLNVLSDIVNKDPDFDFLDSEQHRQSQDALNLGIDAVLQTQVHQNGVPTVWCAQHDKTTLEPTWARTYEPPSLSGSESVGLVRFLMSLDAPSDDIIASIEGAITWFKDNAIYGYRYERFTNEEGLRDSRITPDPDAPPLWARFYELQTNRPLFLDRDSKFRYQLSEVGRERRAGYAYYGNWAHELLTVEYPQWHLKWGKTTNGGALDAIRHRVIVSTDIGGTDPDDFQSMVHLLLYADVLDIEGLISSPYGPGRKEHILEVIDHYEQDYASLRQASHAYPSPHELRTLTKQGAKERADYTGVGEASEGSALLVKRARVEDARPLHVLVWGGLEDLAQALHDAPDILPKLRVYWIGGPNKKWSPDAYQYIVEHHPELWIIEANATYRGWFVGGNQTDSWSNTGFVSEHIAGRGSLGTFFATQLGGTIKMGDTPSVGWLLKGSPESPKQPGWGGQFVRAWAPPYYNFTRMTTEADHMHTFGILELTLPLQMDLDEPIEAFLEVTNQSLPGFVAGDGTVRFRFSPKATGVYEFTIRSNVPALDGLEGGITALDPPPGIAQQPSDAHPNWWTDNPSPFLSEDGHIGAKTVNQWREDFLHDFAVRMSRVILSQP